MMLIPETPRWLTSHDRLDDFLKVVAHAAKLTQKPCFLSSKARLQSDSSDSMGISVSVLHSRMSYELATT